MANLADLTSSQLVAALVTKTHDRATVLTELHAREIGAQVVTLTADERAELVVDRCCN